jgi:hypothetical protein
MQDWLESVGKYTKNIDICSSSTVIHKARSKTLASRVKTVFDAITAIDPNSINMNDVATKGYFSMLLATFEEISGYFTILQKKDKKLSKRVKRYGSDEETFSKWIETLQTCCCGVGVVVGEGLFDQNQDLNDFNDDLNDLRLNMKEILGFFGAVERSVEAGKELLAKQQVDRTEYRTQQAVKVEFQFDIKLIRYEKIIGRGGKIYSNVLGFGEVWKARYRGDFLAIKKVPAINLNNQAIASLKLEAEFMKKLSHPIIVSCFGIIESEGSYCMVMELCVNGSLSDYMAANQAETVHCENRTDFAVDIATGINYLHRLGVIHRDLKLANVVLDKHDRGKITDFGLSVVKSTFW